MICNSCDRKTIGKTCPHMAYNDGDLCRYFLGDDFQKLEGMFPDLDAATPGREQRKWDKGKLKYSLVIPEFTELMAEILTKGEINHPKEPDGTPSWQLVEPVAYQDALDRHFMAYKKGEMIDPDPTMATHHMGNIAVNAMFLWWFSRQPKGE